MTKAFYTNVSRYGNSILLRGFDELGQRVNSKIKYQPTFFVGTSRPTSWKSLTGVPVAPVMMDSMREAKE